jgi:hypothetical protein
MIEEAVQRPSAVTVIAEHAGRRGADLFGRLKLSLGNAARELVEPCAHPLHRVDAVPALKRLAFFGAYDEHPHARLVKRDLLNQRLGRCRLLARRDVRRSSRFWAAVADEHDALEAEALLEIAQHFGHRLAHVFLLRS